jgi:hypothetical protein
MLAKTHLACRTIVIDVKDLGSVRILQLQGGDLIFTYIADVHAKISLLRTCRSGSERMQRTAASGNRLSRGHRHSAIRNADRGCQRHNQHQGPMPYTVHHRHNLIAY